MKRDWDQRARENAKWYINTLSVEQSEEEFDRSGQRDVEMMVQDKLELLTERRDPKTLRVLEIGAGIGRMTRWLAELFGEVHAVDVSGEMVRQGRERLRHLPHVHFHETNGTDFAPFPTAHFDLILSFWVFQHLPDINVIRANIRDAFRVLKPGGVFLFQCNGTTNQAFQEQPKDTWAGATFAEPEIRQISRELGAQLCVVANNNTLYCWALLRKRLEQSASPVTSPPQILTYSGTNDISSQIIPEREGEVVLRLLLSGFDREAVDANNLFVEVGEHQFPASYVGTIANGVSLELMHRCESEYDGLLQVRGVLPPEIPAGETTLRVCGTNMRTPAIRLQLPPLKAQRPVIHLISNAEDSGTDIYASGPKSLIRLFILGLAEEATMEGAAVQLNERRLTPQQVSYLPGIASWEVVVQLPPDTPPGLSEFRFLSGESSSLPLSAMIRTDHTSNQ